MKLRMKLTVLLGALVLAAVPAMASASGQPSDPGSQGKGPPSETPANSTPGPKAPLPDKAKAYGVHCKDQSREHVKGEKGTPFSQCVTAMARAANNEDLTPSQACREMSREHVKGEQGTPFSRCVVAAAQLQKEQQQEEQQS